MRTITLTEEEAKAVRLACSVINIWDVKRRMSEEYGEKEANAVLPVANRAFAKILTAKAEPQPQRFPMEGK